jgi:hypothetical protein
MSFHRPKREQELVERQQEQEARRPPRVSLQEEVERILGNPTMQVTTRLHRIASLCFGQEWLRTRVEGTWEALSTALQARLLATVRGWLDEATPAPLSTGSTFSTAELAEGVAFADGHPPTQPLQGHSGRRKSTVSTHIRTLVERTNHRGCDDPSGTRVSWPG